MAVKQKKNKKYTPEEINMSIYGPDGLYDRVISELKKDTVINMSKRIKFTRAAIYIFMEAKDKDGNYHHRPKFDTIMKYAKRLDVK